MKILKILILNYYYQLQRIKLIKIRCGLGLYSHFNPYKFPDNKWILIGCVFGYALCNVIYEIYDRSLKHVVIRAYPAVFNL